MEKFHPTAHTRNNILLFIKKVAAVSVVLYIYICFYTEYLYGKKMIYLSLDTNCLRLV